MKRRSLRDDFSPKTRTLLAARAGYRCSRPGCEAPTSGPQSNPDKTVNVGVAAHVTAASIGGPRYDASLSPEERSDVANGIWLCQTCAKLIDADPGRFSTAELGRFKEAAELAAQFRLGRAVGDGFDSMLAPEEVELLYSAAVDGDLWAMSTMRGKWIRSGEVDFRRDDDTSFAAQYLDAFDLLKRRELVRHSDGSCYSLTGEGFRVARMLAGGLQNPPLADDRIPEADGQREFVPRRKRRRSVGTARTAGLAMSCEIENISTSGALLRTDGPIEVGGLLNLSLRLDEGFEVAVAARVVRVQEPSWKLVAGVGVAFTDFQEDGKRLLDTWIQDDDRPER